MGKVAIQGHATRGLEVIGILEALGGKNCKCLDGTETSGFYYIDDSGVIRNSRGARGVLSITCFKLEEFLEKYPYKVGDKVEVSHPDDSTGILIDEIISMRWNGSEIRYEICDLDFRAEEIRLYREPIILKGWSQGEMLERLSTEGFRVKATDNKEETMEDKPNLLQQLKEYFENTPREVVEKEWHEYDKYNEIGPSVEEYLEYVNNIRNPIFPKTYKECCDVLGLNTMDNDAQGYKADLIIRFQELLIARDAYRKLTGDWEPDWEDSTPKYGLIVSGNRVKKQKSEYVQMKFCFPTEDILDAFCENFDKPINNCKEML